MKKYINTFDKRLSTEVAINGHPGWHDYSCCCNCVHLITIKKHPLNRTILNGSIMETGGYGCGVKLDMKDESSNVMFFEGNHGFCELHTKKEPLKLISKNADDFIFYEDDIQKDDHFIGESFLNFLFTDSHTRLCESWISFNWNFEKSLKALVKQSKETGDKTYILLDLEKNIYVYESIRHEELLTCIDIFCTQKLHDNLLENKNL